MTIRQESPEIEILNVDDTSVINERSQESDDGAKEGIVEQKLSGTRVKTSRSEKKTRKIFSKLGLKLISGVERIVIKKSKQVLFCLENPDVYKSPNSDTYIIFGDALTGSFILISDILYYNHTAFVTSVIGHDFFISLASGLLTFACGVPYMVDYLRSNYKAYKPESHESNTD
ncbi:LOW QUALITY PROTEIN: hypothetical protein MXB_1534 [Myxobolus squamalis]|nr:LOW QUALITY PROTEIN: hypothetical protein MXB_1534 [Myxobolus squamalis]